MFGKPRYKCHIILLKAAVVANVEILQPALYHSACSTFTLDHFFNEFDGPLDTRCLRLLVCGKDSISREMHLVISLYLEESERCILSHHGDSNVVGPLTGLQMFMGSSTLSLIRWKRLEKQWSRRLCAECKKILEIRIECMQAQIWDRLPSFFGLPGWDTLRANCEV